MISLAIFIVAIALIAVVVVFLFVLSLCRAAANGDRLHERAEQTRREFRE